MSTDSSSNVSDKTEYRFADGVSRLGTETAFEVLARAKALEAQGRSIVHLEIGEPDFDTPKHIIEAACKALQSGHTHYTNAAGIPELRSAIVRYISRTRGVSGLTVDNVVVTPGAKPIIFYTCLSLLQPGDEALYLNPGFPIYESMINFTGAKAVPLPLHFDGSDFYLDMNEVESLITERTRLIIINTPANPTGFVFTAQQLRAIADLAIRRDLMVLADEVYCGILYPEGSTNNSGEKTFHSIYSLPGMMSRTILLDGYSKTYAMTGWRMGFGVMPREIAQKFTKFMINSNSCTAAFSQQACIAALEGPMDEVHTMVDAFHERRDVIVRGLNEIPGFVCPCPRGAFYVFPNVERTGIPSKTLADALLQRAGVACLDGACFGQYGTGFIRFSYANSLTNIQEALRRIDKCVRELMAEQTTTASSQ